MNQGINKPIESRRNWERSEAQRIWAQNWLNREKKITVTDEKIQIFPLCFQSSQHNTGLFFSVNLIVLQPSAQFRELDYSHHALAEAVSSLLPSTGYLLCIIFFSKFAFENLNANQLSNVNFSFCFPSVFRTWLPFIQLVLEEPAYFPGIFFFSWYIFTKMLLHYRSCS